MYHLQLENFEGPFDLLYQLLERNKLDINEISLASIAEQYLEYVRQMQELDLETASEFLLMAVKLVEIKTRRLLPRNKGEKEEEGRKKADDLVQKVLEYRKFKELACELRMKEEERQGIFSRDRDQILKIMPVAEFEVDPLEGVTLKDLVKAFDRALIRMREMEEAKRKEELKVYQWERISVKDKIKEIKTRLKSSPGGFYFENLFDGEPSRVELVVTFLALLELIKQKRLRVIQVQAFEKIRIKPR